MIDCKNMINIKGTYICVYTGAYIHMYVIVEDKFQEAE